MINTSNTYMSADNSSARASRRMALQDYSSDLDATLDFASRMAFNSAQRAGLAQRKALEEQARLEQQAKDFKEDPWNTMLPLGATGAQLGSMLAPGTFVAPGIGAALGAGIGAITSIAQSKDKSQSVKDLLNPVNWVSSAGDYLTGTGPTGERDWSLGAQRALQLGTIAAPIAKEQGWFSGLGRNNVTPDGGMFQLEMQPDMAAQAAYASGEIPSDFRLTMPEQSLYNSSIPDYTPTQYNWSPTWWESLTWPGVR